MFTEMSTYGSLKPLKSLQSTFLAEYMTRRMYRKLAASESPARSSIPFSPASAATSPAVEAVLWERLSLSAYDSKPSNSVGPDVPISTVLRVQIR